MKSSNDWSQLTSLDDEAPENFRSVLSDSLDRLVSDCDLLNDFTEKKLTIFKYQLELKLVARKRKTFNST